MTNPARPPNQRWIKRPPRPSRAKPPVVRRQAPGMAGLFAGLGLAIGFTAFWRGMGGTREDIRNLFR